MKTFIKISENNIINLNNIIKINKATIEINNKFKYCIEYYTTDLVNNIQRFDSKEERDLFFDNICNDLTY